MNSETQVFYITIASMGVGLMLACMRSMYKSKCSKIQFCGVIIERDTATEGQYDESHPIEESKNNNVNNV